MYERRILELITYDNPKNPLEYAINIVKPYMIEKINASILSCHDCKHCSQAKSIFYSEHTDASILFIGESVLQSQQDKECVIPYEDSEELSILQSIFSNFPVNRKHFCYMNVVNCLPCKDKRLPPTTEQKNNCRIYLDAIIDTVRPHIIIALGTVSAKMLLNSYSVQNRGKWYSYKNIQVMPTHSLTSIVELNKSDKELANEYIKDVTNDLRVVFDYIYTNLQLNIVIDKNKK